MYILKNITVRKHKAQDERRTEIKKKIKNNPIAKRKRKTKKKTKKMKKQAKEKIQQTVRYF